LYKDSIYEESIDDFIYIDASKNDEKLIEERKIQLADERKRYSDLIFDRVKSSRYFTREYEIPVEESIINDFMSL